VPAVDADKSIAPVDASIVKPDPELNVPPLVPVTVGVGSVPIVQ